MIARATSAWRVDDVVAYDEMRALAATVVAHLTDQSGDAGADAAGFLTEAERVRDASLRVDGFDRTAVDTHSRGLELRLAELATDR